MNGIIGIGEDVGNADPFYVSSVYARCCDGTPASATTLATDTIALHATPIPFTCSIGAHSAASSPFSSAGSTKFILHASLGLGPSWGKHL